jgi:hypothetical protein
MSRHSPIMFAALASLAIVATSVEQMSAQTAIGHRPWLPLPIRDCPRAHHSIATQSGSAPRDSRGSLRRAAGVGLMSRLRSCLTNSASM